MDKEKCKTCINCNLLCYDISMITFYWCDKIKQQVKPTDGCKDYATK